MPEDNKVNIKIELGRDNSGKLRLIAHFNSKAPNVFIDKNEYIWMPTIEEKDLINDAFGFIPSNTSISNEKPDLTEIEHEIKEEIASEPEPIIETKPEIEKEIPPEPDPVVEEEPELKADTFDEKEIELEPEKEIEEPEIKTELEEPVDDEPSVFEKIKEDLIINKPEEEPDDLKIEDIEEPKNEMEPKIEIKEEKQEVAPQDKKDEEKELEKGLIVEADEEAIQEALKKHDKFNDEKDNSMREVDEKTIIDRVLKQKKKGKWTKK